MKSGQWLKLRLGFSSSQLNMGEERALYFGGNLYCGPVPIISSSHGIDMIYTQIVVVYRCLYDLYGVLSKVHVCRNAHYLLILTSIN